MGQRDLKVDVRLWLQLVMILSLAHLHAKILGEILGEGFVLCSTVVEHAPCDQEVVGSNIARSWAFLSYLPFR